MSKKSKRTTRVRLAKQLRQRPSVQPQKNDELADRAYTISKSVFEQGYHAVLEQEGLRYGTLKALYALKSLDAC